MVSVTIYSRDGEIIFFSLRYFKGNPFSAFMELHISLRSQHNSILLIFRVAAKHTLKQRKAIKKWVENKSRTCRKLVNIR